MAEAKTHKIEVFNRYGAFLGDLIFSKDTYCAICRADRGKTGISFDFHTSIATRALVGVCLDCYLSETSAVMRGKSPYKDDIPF